MPVPKFKAHPSGLGKLMAKISAGTLTEVQAKELHDLQNPKKLELTATQQTKLDKLEAMPRSEAQESEYQKLILKRDTIPERTQIQKDRIAELIAKRDAAQELPAGAKTACKEWVIEQLYKRRKEFSSKQTSKGNNCEYLAVADYNVEFGTSVEKNEDTLENEWFVGTPDIRTHESRGKKRTTDTKVPYDPFTMPLLESDLPEVDYFWQGQAYMDLEAASGPEEHTVYYYLADADMDTLNNETRAYMRRHGMDDDSFDEAYEYIEKQLSYGDLPDNIRRKWFDIPYNANAVESARQRVEMCRAYIEQTFGHWFDQPVAEPQVIAFNQYDYLYNDPVVLLDMIAKCESVEHLTMLWNANPHHHEAHKPVFSARRLAISNP